MTVGELLRRASSRELTEWMAYDRLLDARGPMNMSELPTPSELQAKVERAFKLTG